MLKDLILACFDSGSEETKSAAAYALGHLAVGNMVIFLPVVLEAVENNRHQYLLLASLKEIILEHANKGKDFSSHLQSVLPGLLKVSGGCACMYICMCMYEYIYKYTCACININIYTCIHKSINKCICLYVHIYIYILNE